MGSPAHCEAAPRRAIRQLLGLTLLCSSCYAQNRLAPVPVEQLFPPRNGVAPPAANQLVDVNIDGTLSMQGFAKAANGNYSQLLLDLDRSLAVLWNRANIRYRRFGAKPEPIKETPAFVAASRPAFYSGSGNYTTTRIDEVLRDGKPAQLTIIVTDLYQQDMNISAIQEAIRSRDFPVQTSLGLWRWMVDFNGQIYDYSLDDKKGQAYAGPRPLYFLAVAPEPVLKQWKESLERAVTALKPEFLAISSNLAENPNSWLRVRKLEKLANKGGASSAAIPYAIYRTSAGCSSAVLELTPELRPASFAIPFTPTVLTENVRAELFALTRKDKIEPRSGASAAVERPAKPPGAKPVVRVTLDCQAIRESTPYLLRVREMAAPSAFTAPAWVASASVTGAQIATRLANKDKTWGAKTLNLSPFVSDLVATAMRDVTAAASYFYIVKE